MGLPRSAPASGPRGPGRGQYDRSATAEERRTEHRLRLLQAAAAVFARSGFQATTINLVVQEAGMSSRTFYEHFQNLSDVLRAIYDHGAQARWQEVQVAARSEAEPAEQIRAGIRAYLASIQQHAALSLVLYYETSAMGRDFIPRHEAMRARYVALWLEGLGDAHARGLARRAPTELSMYALVCSIESVGIRYLQRGEVDRIFEALEPLVELVTGSVGLSAVPRTPPA